ncbi:hypothetical protein ED733_001619 [Metarhizium rileyi]|uniref:Uncharacterized protein n=1 Tax=Metarhizium rileyi (strain RCEF 4871) TaxID=1649241 RepID=A0A5C6FZB6_METRR|nr:hypothetical protein ED733_001619 [Metarhizium rileyi]
MSTERSYTICIIAFRGSPDHHWNRHVGLWFLPITSGSHYYFHAKGIGNTYELDIKRGWNPTDSYHFANLVTVASTSKTLTNDKLEDLMAAVPTASTTEDHFNCQTWVAYALDMLQREGYLTKQECTAGIDSMIDLTFQALEEG